LCVSSGFGSKGTVTVFRLPSGDKLSSFGNNHDSGWRLQSPQKLRFTSKSTLLIAEFVGKRVAEVAGIETGESKLVNYVGDGQFSHCVVGLDCNDDFIVATQPGADHQFMLFDSNTRQFIRGFGRQRTGAGEHSECRTVCISPDGRFVLAPEVVRGFVNVFTTTGEYVTQYGPFGSDTMSLLVGICITSFGELVIAGQRSHAVMLVSAATGEELCRLGKQGGEDGCFESPADVAVVNGCLYVLDETSSRVQVFM
jgi:hypothetical protein